jgi:FkbM family methyltransferase
MRRALRLVLLRSPRLYRVLRQILQIARYLARRPHEPEFAAFAQFGARAGMFLDVGANTGTSAMSFRIFCRPNPILSIEPSPALERELRLVRRLVRRMDYLICAAGEQNGRMSLYTPAYRRVPVDTVASVRRDSVEERWSLRRQLGERVDGPQLEVREQSVPVRRLDDLALAPAFVKVDVEGFELEVLRGLAETLHSHHPIVLVERSASYTGVEEFLGGLGYSAFAYLADAARLVPFASQDVTNVFFLPPDVAARDSGP